jgi:hypothetical protein
MEIYKGGSEKERDHLEIVLGILLETGIFHSLPPPTGMLPVYSTSLTVKDATLRAQCNGFVISSPGRTDEKSKQLVAKAASTQRQGHASIPFWLPSFFVIPEAWS